MLKDHNGCDGSDHRINKLYDPLDAKLGHMRRKWSSAGSFLREDADNARRQERESLFVWNLRAPCFCVLFFIASFCDLLASYFTYWHLNKKISPIIVFSSLIVSFGKTPPLLESLWNWGIVISWVYTSTISCYPCVQLSSRSGNGSGGHFWKRCFRLCCCHPLPAYFTHYLHLSTTGWIFHWTWWRLLWDNTAIITVVDRFFQNGMISFV